MGGKQLKGEATMFLYCCFKDANEKILVRVKASEPNCFKDLPLLNLFAPWEFNKRSQMISEIMEKRSKAFNRKCKWRIEISYYFWITLEVAQNYFKKYKNSAFFKKSTRSHIQTFDRNHPKSKNSLS